MYNRRASVSETDNARSMSGVLPPATDGDSALSAPTSAEEPSPPPAAALAGAIHDDDVAGAAAADTADDHHSTTCTDCDHAGDDDDDEADEESGASNENDADADAAADDSSRDGGHDVDEHDGEHDEDNADENGAPPADAHTNNNGGGGDEPYSDGDRLFAEWRASVVVPMCEMLEHKLRITGHLRGYDRRMARLRRARERWRQEMIASLISSESERNKRENAMAREKEEAEAAAGDESGKAETNGDMVEKAHASEASEGVASEAAEAHVSVEVASTDDAHAQTVERRIEENADGISPQSKKKENKQSWKYTPNAIFSDSDSGTDEDEGFSDSDDERRPEGYVVDKYFIPKEPDDFLKARKRYAWRGILGQNYSDRPDLMPRPLGSRDPSRRFAWESGDLDVCLVLELGDFDVEYILARMNSLLFHDEPVAPYPMRAAREIVHSDFSCVLLLACAVLRRWMAEFCPRHVDCGTEAVTVRYSEIMQAAVPFVPAEAPPDEAEDATLDHPIGNYIFRYLLEIRRLAANHVARMLCDATRAPTRAVPHIPEAMRVAEIQRLRSDTKRAADPPPRLDLDQRLGAEASDYVRRCPPMWRSKGHYERPPDSSRTFEELMAEVEAPDVSKKHPCGDPARAESAYVRYLIDRIPRAMSVPHPLSAFAVRPFNPIVALGNHFTCDLCYTPHIRASYQAVTEEGNEGEEAGEGGKADAEADGDDADAATGGSGGAAAKKQSPPPTAEERNAVELMKNCFGFDLCIRCAGYYYNESLRAVASAVMWRDVGGYCGGESDGNAPAPDANLVETRRILAAAGVGPAKDSHIRHPQVTLCASIGGAAAEGGNVASPTTASVSSVPFTNPSSPTTLGGGAPHHHQRSVPASVRIVATGSRPTIDINNQLFILDNAVVRLRNTTSAAGIRSGLASAAASASVPPPQQHNHNHNSANASAATADALFASCASTLTTAAAGGTLLGGAAACGGGAESAAPKGLSASASAASAVQIAGTLVLKVAVAPLGARPLARKWRPSFADAVAARAEVIAAAAVERAAAKEASEKFRRAKNWRRHHSEEGIPPKDKLACTCACSEDKQHHDRERNEDSCNVPPSEHCPSPSSPPSHDDSCPAAIAAAARLIAVSEAMETYFGNASRCFSKRYLTAEERALVPEDKRTTTKRGADGAEDDDDDESEEDEEENNCPICMEALAPRAATNMAVLNSADANNVENDFCFANTEAAAAATAAAPSSGGGSSALTRAVVQTTCRHWFHVRCLDRYFAESRGTMCPMCRTPDALDTLTARRFMKKAEADDEAATASSAEGGGGDVAATSATSATAAAENAVTPSMIAAETRRNLKQNIYELHIPLTLEEIQRGYGGGASSSSSASEPLRVLVGTLVSLDGRYHNPTDIGCLAQLEVTLFSL